MCRRRQVSGASLAAFRIVYGVVGVVSMVRLEVYGWVTSLYAGPERHFTYPGLRFVTDPGLLGMHALVVVVGVAALAVAVGLRTRLALATFVTGFTWIEFIDATTYLNHYWFVSVVGVGLLLAPLDRCLALRPSRGPVAVGWVWLLRVQVGMVYVFAGLAKLNADWLVDALPLRLWLPAHSALPVIGRLLELPVTAHVASWAGALYDCSIVVLLCWARTRLAAWLAVVAFHVVTWVLFPIGVFPWLMIGAATIFFAPDWPHRVAARLANAPGRGRPTRPVVPVPSPRPVGAAVAVPDAPGWRWRLALTWTAVVLVLPLRAGAIPGDARWTGEGYRFSWNVLRVEKAGDVRFRVQDLDSGVWTIDTAEELYTPLQWKAMSSEPELIRQAAHVVRAQREAGGAQVAVHVDAFVSLNGRRAVRMIDPDVDLGREPYRILGQPWILPPPTHAAP